MADKKLEKLLAKAQNAYQQGDKKKGTQYIDEILKKDFNHAGAWQLLYRLYGAGKSFDEFQISFCRQYYPERVFELRTGDASHQGGFSTVVEEPEAKKPSFWARLFGRGKKQAPPAKPPAGAGTPHPPAASFSEHPAVQPSDARPTDSSSAAFHPGTAQRGEPADQRAIVPAPPATSGLTPAQPLSEAHRKGEPPVSRLPLPPAPAGKAEKIRVIVVDDVPQTRETVIRALRFQEDIDVIGTATNGLQAIKLVKEMRPDVVVMDVNMPDMDGIAATSVIKHEVPFAEVIILTVQDDIDYMRRAMNAGARDFMAKPPMIEELVDAVQRAGAYAIREREKAPSPAAVAVQKAATLAKGKIISVYSSRGGAGCTLLAANLAAILHSDENEVVIVDGNLQYGDVAVLYNIQSKTSLLDLTPHVEELDAEMIDAVISTHSSGIKILPPSRPERAELVTGPQFSQLLAFLSKTFKYVIVDTTHRLNDVTLAALDSSDLIVLVTTQDIPSIARTRKFLDLVPLLNIDAGRFLVVMNQYDSRVGILPEKVGKSFEHPIAAVIPVASDVVLASVNRGVPFMLQKDLHGRPISRAMVEMADAVRQRLTAREDMDEPA